MKIYIGIDKETWENIVVEASWVKAMEEIWHEDVYFLSEEDLRNKYSYVRFVGVTIGCALVPLLVAILVVLGLA